MSWKGWGAAALVGAGIWGFQWVDANRMPGCSDATVTSLLHKILTEKLKMPSDISVGMIRTMEGGMFSKSLKCAGTMTGVDPIEVFGVKLNGVSYTISKLDDGRLYVEAQRQPGG